jgi:Fe-S cluster biogenesis protein NfuA
MSFLSRLFGGAARSESAAKSAPVTGNPARIAEAEAILSELRPLFRADGGDMILAAVTADGDVELRARGACHGCAVSDLTLRGALAPRLRERCTWFREVRFV